MAQTASAIAESMRRESFGQQQQALAHDDNNPDAIIVGMGLLIVVLLHLYKAMLVFSDPLHTSGEVLSLAIVLLGCILYTLDARQGNVGHGVLKLITSLIAAHVVIPSIFGTSGSQSSCSHANTNELDDDEYDSETDS